MAPQDTTPKHVPHRQLFIKFALLSLILMGYVGYLSYEYDLVTGGIAAGLTWAFFVMCTPVADAGFLLDFPLRLLFGIRMVVSELVVWGLAMSISVLTLLYAPEYYGTTALTHLFQAILAQPYPYWGLVLLSVVGTFLSLRIGDELMDVIHHKDRAFMHKHGYKHELLVMIGVFILILIAYYETLQSLGVEAIFSMH